MNLQLIPFIRFIIPLIFGILCAKYYPHHNFLLLITIVSFISVFSVFISLHFIKKYKNRYFYGIFIYLIFFSLGYLIYTVQNPKNNYNYFEKFTSSSHNDTLNVKITNITKTKKEKLYLIYCDVENVFYNAHWKKTSGKLLLYFNNVDNYKIEINDKLLIKTKVKHPKNSNSDKFNFISYLENQFIYLVANLHSNQVLNHTINKKFSLSKFANKLQQYYIQQLQKKRLKNQNLNIIRALFIGDKSYLNPEIKSSFSNSGAMHILAVSGLHIGIVFIFISTIINLFDRNKKHPILHIVILISFLWIFCIFSGLSPSSVRASIMFSIFILAIYSNRNYNIYNTIGFSAFIMILFQPNIIFQLSFLFSYGAILGIVTIYPLIYKLFIIQNKILDWIWSICCVSIAAQLFVSPLVLFYFNKFPNYFIVTNIFIIPLVFIVICSCLIFFAIHSIPYISTFITQVINFFTDSIIWIITTIDSFPYSTISNIHIEYYEMIILFLIFSSLLFYIYQRYKLFIYLTFIFIISFQLIHLRIGQQNKYIIKLNISKNKENNFKIKLLKNKEIIKEIICPTQKTQNQDLKNQKLKFIPNDTTIIIKPKYSKNSIIIFNQFSKQYLNLNQSIIIINTHQLPINIYKSLPKSIILNKHIKKNDFKSLIKYCKQNFIAFYLLTESKQIEFMLDNKISN